MANIYTAVRGTVSKSAEPAIGLASLSIASDQYLIVTGVSITRNQVTQYVKTLDNSIFGYAWGEGPGKIVVSGIIFLAPNCKETTGGGLGVVNSYYSSNNVYSSSGPISMAIGNVSLLGYLEGMNITAEMSQFNFANFALEFVILNGGSA